MLGYLENYLDLSMKHLVTLLLLHGRLCVRRSQWLRSRASDSRLRKPGFESCAAVLKPWAILFKCAHYLLADWNKDWKPGPYPRTPKERAAAAKKYGLRVEDYEPYPDDGFGYGDYPKLPRISDEAKDPYLPYDTPHNKRFFGEPVSRQRCIRNQIVRVFFTLTPNKYIDICL